MLEIQTNCRSKWKMTPSKSVRSVRIAILALLISSVGLCAFARQGPCIDRTSGTCSLIACDGISRDPGSMNCTFLGQCSITGCFDKLCVNSKTGYWTGTVRRTNWNCSYTKDSSPGERTCYGTPDQPGTTPLPNICCECRVSD